MTPPSPATYPLISVSPLFSQGICLGSVTPRDPVGLLCAENQATPPSQATDSAPVLWWSTGTDSIDLKKKKYYTTRTQSISSRAARLHATQQNRCVLRFGRLHPFQAQDSAFDWYVPMIVGNRFGLRLLRAFQLLCAEI